MKKTLAALAAALVLSPAGAETLTWSSAGDFLSFEPTSMNVSLNIAGNMCVYEPLVRRGRKSELEPCLATSWKYDAGRGGWIFKLREGVKFADGKPFTAEDVVFSFKRYAHPKSQMRSYVQGFAGAEILGPHEVLIKTETGTPVFINQIVNVLVMCKAWLEEHGGAQPPDYSAHEESYAARHTNGTGPYRLVSRKDDVETVFEENANWWDKASRAKTNVTRVVYRPIKSAATRTAALLSGDLDFVLDPAVQDVARIDSSKAARIVRAAENRAIFLQMNVHDDKLAGIRTADGKPAEHNPFMDVRVRKALYQAIDIGAIEKRLMRGAAERSGMIVGKTVDGWDAKINERYPFDLAASRKLLADAGYPNGFGFDMHCINNRYINDEAVCKAVVSMWAKVGMKINLLSMPQSKYWAAVQPPAHPVLNMMGYGCPTFDSLYLINECVAKFDPKGVGVANCGYIDDPEINKLVPLAQKETDPARRAEQIRRIWQIVKDKVYLLPLYTQIVPWAARRGVEVTTRPDNRLMPQWCYIKPEARK